MGAKGTNTMFVMKPEEGDHTSAARLATYANIVTDYQLQKDNRTKFVSKQVATLSINMENRPHAQQILQHQNSIGIGTASSAHNKQNICA